MGLIAFALEMVFLGVTRSVYRTVISDVRLLCDVNLLVVKKCFRSHVDDAVMVNIQPINQQVNHLQSVSQSASKQASKFKLVR